MGNLVESFIFERHAGPQRRRQPQRQAVTRDANGHYVISKRKIRKVAHGDQATHRHRSEAAKKREQKFKAIRHRIVRNRLRTFKHRKLHHLDRKRIAGHHK